ncbi:MAG: 3'(2'),5'-bisphosphate nucleotidase CysQ [Chromatiales bacterium]|nr:3'(2'),5'-bisphosphate nucleotidase CysQ [Chromatiales bacterium]
MTTYHQYIDQVCSIARLAGHEIMDIYKNHDFDVNYKEDKSPVTIADLKSDTLITEQLNILSPDIPVLSEETSSEHPYEERRQWQRYWLVDPLDGTKGFIHRNDFFTVNIALIENHTAVLGVIYTPAKDQLYYAAEGYGAYRQDGNAKPRKISVCKQLRAKPIVTVSRAHINVPTRNLLEKIGDHELLRADSSLKCCLIADGSADLYVRVGPTYEWDTAAGQCIVEQAGGILSDYAEQPLRYNTQDSLINPPFVVHSPASPEWRPFVSLDN